MPCSAANPRPSSPPWWRKTGALLLGRLEPAQRQIAQWKLDGYTNAEIAQRLGCGLRTVERRLELIRRIWEQESQAS